jgi:hypothetical protein
VGRSCSFRSLTGLPASFSLLITFTTTFVSLQFHHNTYIFVQVLSGLHSSIHARHSLLILQTFITEFDLHRDTVLYSSQFDDESSVALRSYSSTMVRSSTCKPTIFALIHIESTDAPHDPFPAYGILAHIRRVRDINSIRTEANLVTGDIVSMTLISSAIGEVDVDIAIEFLSGDVVIKHQRGPVGFPGARGKTMRFFAALWEVAKMLVVGLWFRALNVFCTMLASVWARRCVFCIMLVSMWARRDG